MLYGFKARFVEPIQAGTKGGTIRVGRKVRNQFSGRPGGHARPGERLQLYTGLRTRNCRLIAKKDCRAVSSIALHFEPRPWAHAVLNHFGLIVPHYPEKRRHPHARA